MKHPAQVHPGYQYPCPPIVGRIALASNLGALSQKLNEEKYDKIKAKHARREARREVDKRRTLIQQGRIAS